MKILYGLLISFFLHASCNEIEAKKANELFYEASQAKAISEQIVLLEDSLKLCFTYEVELTLFKLQAEQEEDKEKKLKLYDKALESVSQIKNNDDLVLREQNRINYMIGELHLANEPLIADVYRRKADAQKEVEEKEQKSYLFWIVSIVALLLWAFWDLLRKWGKF